VVGARVLFLEQRREVAGTAAAAVGFGYGRQR
jgi:hypothetical protein